MRQQPPNGEQPSDVVSRGQRPLSPQGQPQQAWLAAPRALPTRHYHPHPQQPFQNMADDHSAQLGSHESRARRAKRGLLMDKSVAIQLGRIASSLLASVILFMAFFSGLLIPQHRALAAGNTVTIHITGAGRPPGFLPSLVTVHVNDLIVFSNDASPVQAYTLATDDGSFSSPQIAPGAQWHLMLTKPGSYEYHAVGAALQMVGTIMVAPTSVALLPTPDPGVIASAIATLQAGSVSSDNSVTQGSGLSQQTIIVLGIVVVLLAGLVAGGIIFWRGRHRKS